MAAICDSKEEDLRILKSEIRSLLISNPSKTVLLNHFLTDYERHIGKPLPYRNFDYKTPLRFLCSLSDVVQVIDAFDGARLKPVTTELSSHISTMVDHQKSANKRPLYGNISYYPSTQYKSKPIPSLQNNLTYQPTPKLEPSLQKPTEKPELSLQQPTPIKESSLQQPSPIKESSLQQPSQMKESSAEPVPKRKSSSPPNSETKSLLPSFVSKTETPSQDILKTSPLESTLKEPPTKSATKSESSSRSTVKSASQQEWIPNSNAVSFQPRSVPPQFYNPTLMRTQPLYPYVGPGPGMVQPYPHHPGNWRQPYGYYNLGYGGPVPPYFVGAPSYPCKPTSMVPCYNPDKPSASEQSTQTPSIDTDEVQCGFTNSTNEIEVAGSDEENNGISENVWSSKQENFSRRSAESPINKNVTSKEHDESVDELYFVSNYNIVDFPVSTADGSVDAASLDVQSIGQENQNCLSTFSDTSKTFEIPSDDVKSKMRAVLEKHTNGVLSSSFASLYEDLHSCSLDIASLGCSMKEVVLKNEDIFLFEKNRMTDDWLLYDARLKPKRRQSHVERNKWIPHYVVDNLAALARKHPEGIDADTILQLYKNEFSMEINPEMLGFDDLYSFLGNCKSIALRKYGDKGMVYPKDWVSKSCDTSEKHAIKEPALPPTEQMKFLWKDYFKEYECDPSFKYKPPIIPESKLLQVKIVDVHSPALIWVQFLDEAKSLNQMMYEMNSHYDIEQEVYNIPENLVVPGLAVVSMFMGKWHRALVVSVSSEHAEILYVDYGTRCRANVSELRKLDRRFGQDRAYALKASLYCLVPFEGDEWSAESCDFLYSTFAEKILYAEICSVNYQGPYVEVMFFDTSGGTEINVHDLLVSKKLARYLTNPASILNDKNVLRFSKFLPRWFSATNRSEDDPRSCLENLMLCTTGGSIPLNIDDVPCCKLHCIQQLCQANSDALASVWQNAIRKVEEQIFNLMLEEVEDSLKEWGWESCQTSKCYCFEGGSQDPPIDVDQFNKTEHLTKEEMLLQQTDSAACVQRKQISVQTTESRASVHQVRRTSEPNNLSQSKSTLKNGFHHSWESGSRNIPRRGWKPLLKYPRVIRYSDAQLGEALLTLIAFKGDIWVCLSQLIKLTKLPSMLAKKRLEISDIKSEFIEVSKRGYPDLYNDLHDLRLMTPEGDPILVLLSAAPKVIRAIDPLGSYQETFEILAKELDPLLDGLIH